MQKKTKTIRLSFFFSIFLLLFILQFQAACSGHLYFSIGGTITGLSGTIVLQNNGSENLTLSQNGNFTFGTAVLNGTPYLVTILTQPEGETCSVANGAGNVNSENVTNIAVTCANNGFSVGGSISGLSGVLVLENNGGDELALASDGDFTFQNLVAEGSSYQVTVKVQPENQTCGVSEDPNQNELAHVLILCSDDVPQP